MDLHVRNRTTLRAQQGKCATVPPWLFSLLSVRLLEISPTFSMPLASVFFPLISQSLRSHLRQEASVPLGPQGCRWLSTALDGAQKAVTLS